MDEQSHLQQTLELHRRRLQELEKKAAFFGVQTDPATSMEIDDVKRKIAHVEEQLDKKLYRDTHFPRSSKAGIDTQKWVTIIGVLALIIAILAFLRDIIDFRVSSTPDLTSLPKQTTLPLDTPGTLPTLTTESTQVSIRNPTNIPPTPTSLQSTSTSEAIFLNIPSQAPVATTAASKDRRTILRTYESVYVQAGWCGLWAYLVEEKGVTGQCPQPRYNQVSDSNVEIVDQFVAKKAGYIIGFVIQADTVIRINYPNCVSFDASNLEVEYQTTNHRYIDTNPQGWIASDIDIRGPITLYLYCNDVDWPNP